MANGFVRLLNRLNKCLIDFRKDIHSLKEHCQMLTEQLSNPTLQSKSLLHHPQSPFKPIKPEHQ